MSDDCDHELDAYYDEYLTMDDDMDEGHHIRDTTIDTPEDRIAKCIAIRMGMLERERDEARRFAERIHGELSNELSFGTTGDIPPPIPWRVKS